MLPEQHTKPVEGSLTSSKGLAVRTFKSILWSSAGTIGQFVSNILVVVILARLLTPSEFGVVGTAVLVVTFVQRITAFGIAQVIIQPVALTKHHINTSFTLALVLGLGGTVLTAALASTVAQFFAMPELTVVLQVLSLILIISNLGIISDSLLRRELQFRTIAFAQTVSSLVGYAVIAVVLAWAGLGLWALIVAQLCQVLLETLILVLARPFALHLHINRDALRDLVEGGGTVTAARLIQFFAVQGDNIVVSWSMGANALGLYSRAYRLVALPANLLGEAVEAVLFPSLSKIQNEPDRLRSAFSQGTFLTALLLLPLSTLTLVLAPEIVLILLGPQWLDAVAPLQALSLGMYFRASYKLGNLLARAKGALRELALLQLLYAALIIVAAFIGSRFGLSGVAAGVALALCLYYLFQGNFARRLADMERWEFLRLHFPALATSIICLILSGTIAHTLRGMSLPALVVLFVTVVVTMVSIVLLWRFAPVLIFGRENAAHVRTILWVEFFKKKFTSAYSVRQQHST